METELKDLLEKLYNATLQSEHDCVMQVVRMITKREPTKEDLKRVTLIQGLNRSKILDEQALRHDNVFSIAWDGIVVGHVERIYEPKFSVVFTPLEMFSAH